MVIVLPMRDAWAARTFCSATPPRLHLGCCDFYQIGRLLVAGVFIISCYILQKWNTRVRHSVDLIYPRSIKCGRSREHRGRDALPLGAPLGSNNSRTSADGIIYSNGWITAGRPFMDQIKTTVATSLSDCNHYHTFVIVSTKLIWRTMMVMRLSLF